MSDRFVTGQEFGRHCAKAWRRHFWAGFVRGFYFRVTLPRLVKEAQALSIYRRIEPHGA